MSAPPPQLTVASAMELQTALEAREGKDGGLKGSEHWFRCPAHPDQRATNCSFNVESQTWFCQVCKTGGGVLDLCRRLDIKVRLEGVTPREDPRALDIRGDGLSWGKGWTVRARYVYEDRDGIPSYEVVRLDKRGEKSFRQAHYTAAGWVKGRGTTQPLLYRLPLLEEVRAQKRAGPVWLVEGEKDAETLLGLGLVGTSQSEGVGRWNPDLTAQLDGLPVIIIPDNDEPGLKHAATVATALDRGGVSVRVLEMPRFFAGLWPSGSDVTDWVEAERAAGVSDEEIREALWDAGSRTRAWQGGGPWRVALWRNRIPRTEKGSVIKGLDSAIEMLSHPAWDGVLGYNERIGSVVFLRRPPIPVARADRRWPQPLLDQDYTAAAQWVSRHGLRSGREMVAQALDLIARRRSYDPVRDYLEGLRGTWDGTARVETLPSRFLGVEETDFSRVAMRAWALSAVARVLPAREDGSGGPGCKADHLLVVDGPQGLGKSTFFRVLARREAWFSDAAIRDLGSKDAAETIQGIWIQELGELEAVTKSSIPALKAFISRQSDRYRAPWSRTAEDRPRRGVMAGTCNESGYLQDSTGNRRFWCLTAKGVPGLLPARLAEELEAEVDQIWAEVVHLYDEGGRWWLTPEEEGWSAEAARSKTIEDPWVQLLGFKAANGGHRSLTTWEALDLLGIQADKQSNGMAMRVGRTLQAMGWTRVQTRRDARRVWVYRAPEREDERW